MGAVEAEGATPQKLYVNVIRFSISAGDFTLVFSAGPANTYLCHGVDDSEQTRAHIKEIICVLYTRFSWKGNGV